MPQESDSQGWKCLNVTVSNKDSGAVIEYKIHFFRRTNGWYDEIRYDSHEIRKGRKSVAHHLHLKLATPLKQPKQGEEELRLIIDRILPALKEIIE
ncbi:MAG: hypothetical protein HY695_01370 [Deltaproteobacteria bacterium]|nr:hypothetical protein [Deltaproteobacteria bacterium]